ncbi:squalene synthase HpnC [Castellaniella sp.]|uniref:squalene synthase HpnC n=1 Tax=Castellaniella sp. TaxID=1955812 RepID=UPI003560445A
MGIDHYENFPVASILLPAHLRPAVRRLYAFARGADDLADEGDAAPAERMQALDRWRAALHALCTRQPLPASLSPDEHTLFAQLNETIHAHQLPIQPLFDLLSAFRQDVRQASYPDDAALVDYCRRSANPVGRLMLHLYGALDPLDVQQSDAICSGLQRANFCQDVALDHAKGRCYIPEDCLRRHGATLDELAALCQAPPARVPAHWQAVLHEQCGQARLALLAGSPLAWRLPGRIGLELRLVVHGGLRILDRLAAGGYNPFASRPILTRRDMILLCWRAFCQPRPQPVPALS